MRIRGTGVAIPGLNSSQVKSLVTLIPPVKVAQVFERLAEPCIGRILASCNQSRTLAALRDTLLPKLISGELRVKDAEKFIQSAV
jgi:type I restriction enzyme S subunit